MNLTFVPMKKPFPFKSGALALSMLVLAGCASTSEVEPSITNIAVTNPNFQTLEDAAIRGDVAGVLGNRNPDPQSQGKFTVFAPTNAAFARLGLRSAADLTTLQVGFLQNTLKYHVFSGSLPGNALLSGSTSPGVFATGSPSVVPTRRIIHRADNSLYVNGARILRTDEPASNGLVHSIDKVLLATGGNVVQSAQALQTAQVFVKPELTFLVAAVIRCNLQGLLSQPGPYTVFAPSDQAFKDAGIASIDAINQMDVPTLTGILANHVLTNPVSAQLGGKFTSELPENTSVTAFGGRPLQLGAFTDGVLTVKGAGNGANVANMVIPDVQCTNGVVHVIDRILLP